MNRQLLQIIWKKRSLWQFAWAGLGYLLGLLLLLGALQLYLEVRQQFAHERGQAEYVVISKKVSMANTLLSATSRFEEAEIEEAKRQAFVKEVGRLRNANFEAYLKARGKIGFSTLMFFEAAPRQFIDNPPYNFRWEPGQDEVPVIVPASFLQMYNYGFALSQGLPQLSRSTLKMLPLKVELRGEEKESSYKMGVVGFSERITSVLVPEDFLAHTNQTLTGQPGDVNRLILRIRKDSEEALADFLEANNYQTSRQALQINESSRMLQSVLGGLGLLGGVFFVFSLVIFVLSFRVILGEARSDLQLLSVLGYSRKNLARHFLVYFFFYMLGLTLLVGAGVWGGYRLLLKFLYESGLTAMGQVSPWVWLVAVLFGFLCFGLNAWVVGRHLRAVEA